MREQGLHAVTLALDAASGGRVIAGVEKAVQFVILMLLTEKGSVPHDAEYGTRFLTSVRRANVNESQMQIAFRDAAQDIIGQQSRYASVDARDDEIVSDVTLEGLAVASPSDTSFTIRVTTPAGLSRRVILPVSLAIK